MPADLPHLDPVSQADIDKAKPIPQAYAGSRYPDQNNEHTHNKRQLNPESERDQRARRPQQQHHDIPAQLQGATNPGPPLQDPPNPDHLDEPLETLRSNSASQVDPEVERLAVERQSNAAKQKKKNPKPIDMDGQMDTRYILRPEAIESVFYMWRITGDATWREKGWRMWGAIEKATWTPIAYSAVEDVNDAGEPKQADSMERYKTPRARIPSFWLWFFWGEELTLFSFWLAETLKYFYLLYSEPDLVSLDEWVFNTEAHPFRRPRAGAR
jgi:Glycosyl hydrolase family 47